MNPKEKATKLTLSFIHVDDRAMKKGSQTAWIDKILAERCAITCCDEIIKSIRWSSDFNNEQKSYWQQVKEELTKQK